MSTSDNLMKRLTKAIKESDKDEVISCLRVLEKRKNNDVIMIRDKYVEVFKAMRESSRAGCFQYFTDLDLISLVSECHSAIEDLVGLSDIEDKHFAFNPEMADMSQSERARSRLALVLEMARLGFAMVFNKINPMPEDIGSMADRVLSGEVVVIPCEMGFVRPKTKVDQDQKDSPFSQN